MDVSSILRHAVEQHLHADGDLSYVQFQILAQLNTTTTTSDSQRMTDLADGVVYSRSALTYQAGLLEARGLIRRASAADDERSVEVSITDAGRALVAQVLPGHVEVVRELLLAPLSRVDLQALTSLLTPIRDHMRAAPPRSATPRRPGRAAGDAARRSRPRAPSREP